MGKKRPKNLSLGFDYKGELSEPIDAAHATARYVDYRKNRNTILLFSAMKVRLGDWEGLALALAHHHVPGFQISHFEEVSVGGRSKVYSPENMMELARKIDEIRNDAKRPGGMKARETTVGAYKHLMTLSGNDDWKKPDNRTDAAWHKRIEKLASQGRKLAETPMGDATHPLLPDFLKDFQKPRRALFREKGKA